MSQYFLYFVTEGANILKLNFLSLLLMGKISSTNFQTKKNINVIWSQV